MALELKVTEVPEGMEEIYIESDDGGFVLDVDGVVSTSELEAALSEAKTAKQKANEFRTNNIKLTKQVEQLGLKGLTSGESTGANEEQVQALIEDAVSDMRIKLDGFETEKNALQSQLEEVVLSDRVKDIAIQHGVFESALPDIVSRARTVFTVKDGKPVPLDKKSRDEDGNVLNPESWLKKLQDDATHLFKPSNGSGATRPNGNGRQSGMREQANRKSTDKIADGLKNRAGSGKTAKQVM